MKPSQPRLYSDRRREPCAHRTIKRYFIICSSLHQHSFIYLLILAAAITPVSQVLREQNNKNASERTTTTTTSGSKTDVEVLANQKQSCHDLSVTSDPPARVNESLHNEVTLKNSSFPHWLSLCEWSWSNRDVNLEAVSRVSDSTFLIHHVGRKKPQLIFDNAALLAQGCIWGISVLVNTLPSLFKRFDFYLLAPNREKKKTSRLHNKI